MRNIPYIACERRLAIKAARQRYRLFTRQDIDRIPQLQRLSPTHRRDMKAISAVLPFRVNEYVLRELIDWDAVPDDPIFKLVFPQPQMVEPEELALLRELVDAGLSEDALLAFAARIQAGWNAQPGGQKELNVPYLDGKRLPGIQHKYAETVLFFPTAGQSCHSHCTYCFRWAQFTESHERRFAHHETDSLVRYLKLHPEVTDVLITGGDPLVMTAPVLRQYVEPLLDPSLEHVRNIRIGSKAISYWPHRFVSDEDADEVLRLFEDVRRAGKLLALMAHFSHPREMGTRTARKALERIRSTGAVIRSQSPLVRGVNDHSRVWAELWRRQVQVGVVPYYMFVARDTGAQRYFKVPLVEALSIYWGACRQISGLARTARGPVMSATPGKILVDGLAQIAGEEVLVLKFIQGRDPEWVGKPFFAALDPKAAWLDELKPAFGKESFFFEAPFRVLAAEHRMGIFQREGRVSGPWHPQRGLECYDT